MARKQIPSDNLRLAFKNKQDEFYTTYAGIESSLKPFIPQFKGKSIYCNCDLEWSNFPKYFQNNFNAFGLKELLVTGLDRDGNGVSFNSPEAIELLKQSDIVITNPPFSLFREYVSLLMEYNKKFLIIGNLNAVTYISFFPYILEKKVWLFNDPQCHNFIVPDDYELRTKNYKIGQNGERIININSAVWYGNIDKPFNPPFYPLKKHYNPAEYKQFDNYDAIYIERSADIPCDYDGMMGVPISFIEHLNYDQFELLGLTNRKSPYRKFVYPKHYQVNPDKTQKSSTTLDCRGSIKLDTPPTDKVYYTTNGTDYYLCIYPRLLIKRK